MTGSLPPQQPLAGPGPAYPSGPAAYPPGPGYPPPGGHLPPTKKPRRVGIIIAVAAVAAVLAAAVGIGAFVGYRALTDDHCDTVADAASDAVTTALTMEAGVTKDVYLGRVREKWTPHGYDTVAEQAGPLFAMRASPDLAKTSTAFRTVNRTVAACDKAQATVALTGRIESSGPLAVDHQADAHMKVTMKRVDGQWRADKLTLQ